MVEVASFDFVLVVVAFHMSFGALCLVLPDLVQWCGRSAAKRSPRSRRSTENSACRSMPTQMGKDPTF